MKNPRSLPNLLVRSTLALAVAGLAWLPVHASAQQKGAEKLAQLKPASTVLAAGLVGLDHCTAAPCPKCKTSTVTVVERTTKATQPQIATQVQRHECGDCRTSVIPEGHGKMKTDKVVHVCRASGGANSSCCATK
ncbi:MAG: hypothetical protein HZA90_25520 [Verrucomicrobia bacterium]|nr:hypothetical protein [Verrucomicrobiota bacterium]